MLLHSCSIFFLCKPSLVFLVFLGTWNGFWGGIIIIMIPIGQDDEKYLTCSFVFAPFFFFSFSPFAVCCFPLLLLYKSNGKWWKTDPISFSFVFSWVRNHGKSLLRAFSPHSPAISTQPSSVSTSNLKVNC